MTNKFYLSYKKDFDSKNNILKELNLDDKFLKYIFYDRFNKISKKSYQRKISKIIP